MSTLLEVFRILLALPGVEYRRRREGPKALLARLRSGPSQRTRDAKGLARLRRLVAAIDARYPGGPNCYRRALVEMTLDGGVAAGGLSLGLMSKGGPLSGHAWLGAGPPDNGQRYDAEFVV